MRRNVSMVFQGRLKGVLWKFSMGFKGIWKKFEANFKEVSKVFQMCSKEVSCVSQESFYGAVVMILLGMSYWPKEMVILLFFSCLNFCPTLWAPTGVWMVYCSAWLRPKLNTKITLNPYPPPTTHHHHPPPTTTNFLKGSMYCGKPRFGMLTLRE